MHIRIPSIRSMLSSVSALTFIALSGCYTRFDPLTFKDDPQSTMMPMSDLALSTDEIYWPVIWITVVIFVLVQVLLTVAVVKFREKPGEPMPEQVHGNIKMELGWTLLPVVILVAIAFPTVTRIWEAQTAPEGEVFEIKVVGKQWWFAFEYPELGLVTANEVHLPAGRPVHLALHSGDVIHAFWVPRLGGKRDLMPGRINHIWLTADMPPDGQDSIRLEGQCAELCGDSHALMRMEAIVHTPESFDKWVAAQKQAAATPTEPLAAKGAETFLAAGCIACHSTDPSNAQAFLAPNLSHFGSRPRLAADRFENNSENLAAWLRNPQAVKPGATMPNLNLNDQQVDALVAYLHSLK